MLLIISIQDLSQHPVISEQALACLKVLATDPSEYRNDLDHNTRFQVTEVNRELILSLKQTGSWVEGINNYYFREGRLSRVDVLTINGQFLDSLNTAEQLSSYLPHLEKLLTSPHRRVDP